MLKLTNTKVVIAGSTIEAYSYPADRPLAYNFTVNSRGKTRSKNTGTDTESVARKVVSNKRSTRRSVQELRKLVNSNTWRYTASDGKICIPLFVTFTFSSDIRDVTIANKQFLKYIHRLNYKLSGKSKSCLKYVSVIGFQDKNRNGVVHYHAVFFNIESEQEIFLQEIWKEGVVDIKKVEDSDNVGLYMSKHIAESSGDVRLYGHKRYFSSRGLFKAFVVKDQSNAQSIIGYIPKESLSKTESYAGFQGVVKCSKYILNKGQTLLEIAPDIKMLL